MRGVLIDELMPRYDFVERHSIRVKASPARAYAALREADLARSLVVRTLLFLRGMGTHPRRLGEFQHGFTLLGDDPPRELVLGIEGPFWQPRCRLREVNTLTFRDPVPSGVARGVWNFAVSADGVISTETRVLCADDARAKFRAYWFFIRPFSGLIRRMMLRAIREHAER